MSNLDELIKNLVQTAKDDLDKYPLLQADTYKSTDFKKNHSYIGHIYLGVLGSWLYDNKCLKENFYEKNFKFDTPVDVSVNLFSGALYKDNLTEHALAFFEYYIPQLYPHDYQNEIVGKNNLSDMSEVNNSFAVMMNYYMILEKRFNLYENNDTSWKNYKNKVSSNINTHSLSIDNWKQKLHLASAMDQLTHKQREQELANFWHLLDMTAYDQNPEAPKFLVTLLNSNLHDDLKQSIITRLAGFPFENSLDAIFSNVNILKKANYLNAALGAWSGDYTDEQLNIIDKKIDSLNPSSRNMIFMTATSAQNQNSKWARKIAAL